MQSTLSALGAAFMVLFLTAGAAEAQGGGSVQAKNAWARATPGGTQTAAAYVTLEAADGDRLTGASTPVAKEAQLHNMTMDNGVMKMRQIDAIDLPAGQAISLKPGGYHIMLTGLNQPLKEGQTFPLTLTFAKAGAQTVTARVEGVGAMGPDATTKMPGMNMPMQH
jgi:periplasmic copper chaperone A